VPDSGRRLLREIQIQATIVSGGDPAAEDPNADREAVGYVITAETVAALGALRPSELALPHPEARRALVLTRGGLGSDRRIGEALAAAGVTVTDGDVAGWDELMVDPEKSRAPYEAIARSRTWLTALDVPAPARHAPLRDVAESRYARLQTAGGAVRETALSAAWGEGRLSAILSEPAAGGPTAELSAVLLNTAGIRASGPGRIWAEAARRWAAHGVPTLRIDLAGSGDSDGDPRVLVPEELYRRNRIDQTLAAVRSLGGRGLPARTLLVGICSSCFLALNAAFEADEIGGLVLLNPNLFFWSEGLEEDRVTGKALDSLKGRAWRKLATGDVTVDEIRRQLAKLGPTRVIGMVRANAQRAQGTGEVFGGIRGLNRETLVLFGEFEAFCDQLEEQGQLAELAAMPHVTLDRISGAPGLVEAGYHTFRTLALQRDMHASIDRALARTLSSGV
jgi:hypothetical protein